MSRKETPEQPSRSTDGRPPGPTKSTYWARREALDREQAEALRQWKIHEFIRNGIPESEAVILARWYHLYGEAGQRFSWEPAERPTLERVLFEQDLETELKRTSEQLSSVAERVGIDSTPLLSLLGNMRPPSAAIWDPAWALVKRLEIKLYGLHNVSCSGHVSHVHTPSPAEHRPTDLIPTATVLEEYQVSRPTLSRAIKDGRLHSYRPNGAKSNSSHKVSRAEIETLWPKKK